MDTPDLAIIAAFVYLYDMSFDVERGIRTLAVQERLAHLRASVSLSRSEATAVTRDPTLFSPFAAAFAIMYDATLGPFRAQPDFILSADDIDFLVPLRTEAQMSFQRAIQIAELPIED